MTLHCSYAERWPAALAWAALVAIGAASSGCGAKSTGAALPATTLRAMESPPASDQLVLTSPRRLDFGEVDAGSAVESVVYVTNRQEETVEIAHVTLSCDCVSFKIPSRELGPGERVAATVKLDLSKEPEFVGGLTVDICGVDAAARELFSLVVSATVCDEALANDVQRTESQIQVGLSLTGTPQ